MPIKKPDEYDQSTLSYPGLYTSPYNTELLSIDRWETMKPTPVDVYRTDPKTGKPESLPHKYNLGDYYDNPYYAPYGNPHTPYSLLGLKAPPRYGFNDDDPRKPIDVAMLHAVNDGMKFNHSLKVTPQGLVAILAQEGRTDFGGNDLRLEAIEHNKDAVAMYNNLKKQGYGEKAALFPALLLEKQRKGKANGVSWQHAWNGLGISELTGKTGAEYAESVSNQRVKKGGSNDAAVNAFAAQMQEPKKPLTLQDVNAKEWAHRQEAIQQTREALLKHIIDSRIEAGVPLSEKEIKEWTIRLQKDHPDAPIPFPDDPNGAIYETKPGNRQIALKQRTINFAAGGPIELPANYRKGGRTRLL